MTRDELDAIETLYNGYSNDIDDGCFHIPELIEMAKEALELREALEALWGSTTRQRVEFCMPMNGHGYRLTMTPLVAQPVRFEGEGATPLEAINNARRGK